MKQYEDQRKDFGSCERSQGPAFSRRVPRPDLQLEGSRFEIRMESTGVNSGRPIRRLIGAAQARDNDWLEPGRQRRANQKVAGAGCGLKVELIVFADSWT